MLVARRCQRGTWGRVAGVLVAWAVLLAVVSLELRPALADRPRWWTLLVLLGPPLSVAVELLAAKASTRGAGVRVSSAALSWTHVAIVLLVCLALAVLAGVAVRM